MWEVQTYFGASDSWENVWHEDEKPLQFATKEEAEEALHDHLDSMNTAWGMGLVIDPYVDSDYRIVEVKHG